MKTRRIFRNSHLLKNDTQMLGDQRTLGVPVQDGMGQIKVQWHFCFKDPEATVRIGLSEGFGHIGNKCVSFGGASIGGRGGTRNRRSHGLFTLVLMITRDDVGELGTESLDQIITKDGEICTECLCMLPE